MSSNRQNFRYWLIIWMYLITFGHFLMGILLAWFSSAEVFNYYHQTILTQFGMTQNSSQDLQKWWLSLFGATLQNIAIFMGILTYVGNKYRSASVWLWMMVGLVVWAPQDVLISLRIDLWLHVWVDLAALILILAPLIALWRTDRIKT
ncbi:MAG: cell division protein [Gammaproteobacteria bacterium]|nr:MAG: cell division protein [Gammaproteobacteria bacterium]